MPDVPFQKPVAGQNPIFIDTPLYAHRKTDSTSFTASTPKNDLHAPSYLPYRKKRCPLKKGKDARTHAKHPYPVATRRSQHRKKTIPTPPPNPRNAPQQKSSTLRENTPPPLMRQGRNLSSGASAPAFDDYFLAFGARIMFIFLPSSLGISSTLANSSKSVAKRSSRISPCSLKTIERPRKKT